MCVGEQHSDPTPSTVGAVDLSNQEPGAQFNRNAHGKTYGSAAEANSVEQLPDLIYVHTDQGGRGYITKEAFNGPAFANPQDAMAWSRANSNQPRVITAYSSDGTTVVGTYTIGKPNPPAPDPTTG
jgi:hypothetical protein